MISSKYVMCAKRITWDQMVVEYYKIRFRFTSNIRCGFISKHTIRCTYDNVKHQFMAHTAVCDTRVL